MKFNVSDLVIKILFKELWLNTITASFFKHSGMPPPNYEEPKNYHEYFDYHCGRPMKLDLTDLSNVDPRVYDRDAGEGKFEAIVKRLRK